MSVMHEGCFEATLELRWIERHEGTGDCGQLVRVLQQKWVAVVYAAVAIDPYSAHSPMTMQVQRNEAIFEWRDVPEE